VNGHLAGTVYTFAEPSVGGVGFVQHLKDFWFGRWEVEVFYAKLPLNLSFLVSHCYLFFSSAFLVHIIPSCFLLFF